MPWWGWLIIGFGLMAAELLGIEAAYYLIFVGVAAILTGLVGPCRIGFADLGPMAGVFDLGHCLHGALPASAL